MSGDASDMAARHPAGAPATAGAAAPAGLPTRPVRNAALDGLRGYAALAVVLWHALVVVDTEGSLTLIAAKLQQVAAADLARKLFLTMLAGDTAVAIFFIMSGAVLMESLSRDAGPVGDAAARFVIRRMFRIYPALWLTVGLTGLAVLTTGGAISPLAVLQNMALYDSPIVGASWTLNVEIVAIVFVIAGFAGYRRFGEAGLVAAFLLALAIVNIPLLKGHPAYAKPYLYCFAAGMTIPTRIGAWIGARLPHRSWPLLLVAMIFARHLFPGFNRVPTLVQETSAALIVLLLFYHRGGALGAFLSRRSSVFLGRISFSFYLLNTPLLIYGLILLAPSAHPLRDGLALGLVIAAVTVPIAYLSLIHVERPGIALGARLADRLRPRRPP